MGYSVATTVLAGAVSYDLTDLPTVKDELSISATNTSDDTWLTRAIGLVSVAIANNTTRVFAPETVQDVFDLEQDPYPAQTPGGFPQLQLSRWPVLAVMSVVQMLAVGAPQALTEGVDFRTNADTGQLLRLNPFTGVGTSWEAIPVTVTYVAGYGASAQEAHAVPGSSPYTVTVAEASAFSCDQSVSYANGTALSPVAANPAQGQYSVGVGVYTLNAADAGQTLTFAYGVRKIPLDLVDISLRLITARYRAKGRDPALIQQDQPNLGTQRWWFGGAPGQKGPFPPDIAAALDQNYSVPVVA